MNIPYAIERDLPVYTPIEHHSTRWMYIESTDGLTAVSRRYAGRLYGLYKQCACKYIIYTKSHDVCGYLIMVGARAREPREADVSNVWPTTIK